MQGEGNQFADIRLICDRKWSLISTPKEMRFPCYTIECSSYSITSKCSSLVSRLALRCPATWKLTKTIYCTFSTIDPSIKADHSVVRQISALVSGLPVMNEYGFREEFLTVSPVPPSLRSEGNVKMIIPSHLRSYTIASSKLLFISTHDSTHRSFILLRLYPLDIRNTPMSNSLPTWLVLQDKSPT